MESVASATDSSTWKSGEHGSLCTYVAAAAAEAACLACGQECAIRSAAGQQTIELKVDQHAVL